MAGPAPCWTFHFTPTSCSWLNAVEGFFAKLTRRKLKHGIFHSLGDLQAAIKRFIKEHNHDPKPFVWKAEPHKLPSKESSKRWYQSNRTVAESRADLLAALASDESEKTGRIAFVWVILLVLLATVVLVTIWFLQR